MKYREHMVKAMTEALRRDSRVLILGEGVTDPKGIFGTTLEAYNEFPDRVIETPVSENMITGACLGLALEGWKPIFVHARADFMMLSMEHLVNMLGKWRSLHPNKPLNVVIRGLVGRGWGQGPNHSQAFHAMFSQVPGLRVLYPVHPGNVPSLLDWALSCGWPTIMQEPRRMYEVEAIDYPQWDTPDALIVTFGDVVLEAATAAQELSKQGIKAQVHPVEDVTGMTLSREDLPTVVADTAHIYFGAAAEVSARLAERGNAKIRRIGPPFMPLPTSVELEKQWYPQVKDIFGAVCDLLGVRTPMPEVTSAAADTFKGPF